MHSIRDYLIALMIGGSFALHGTPAGAQNLEQVFKADDRKVRLAQESQERIDKVVDGTRKLADQYRTVTKETDGLEVYNTLLERQIDNQIREMQALEDSIDQVTVIERQIMPLMLRMIDSLDEFVERDVPFLREDRRERVAGLRTLMERSDVSVAEKFRRVMEAYQIENDFGRTIEFYRDVQSVAGADREVEILRIGRIALLYQTVDQAYSGVWNRQKGDWEELPGAYRSQVRQGLRIAKKQVAPDLLIVPVNAPGDGQ